LSGIGSAAASAMALAPLPDINPLTSRIIKAAMEVHRSLGPGLFESVYLACLLQELKEAELFCETERPLRVVYKNVLLDCGFRIDLIVQNTVVVEVKSVAQIAQIHRAQLKTYLVLAGCPAGLLINFNVPVLKDGVSRVLNTKT
jgi:GxxExxY protein